MPDDRHHPAGHGEGGPPPRPGDEPDPRIPLIWYASTRLKLLWLGLVVLVIVIVMVAGYLSYWHFRPYPPRHEGPVESGPDGPAPASYLHPPTRSVVWSRSGEAGSGMW